MLHRKTTETMADKKQLHRSEIAMAIDSYCLELNCLAHYLTINRDKIIEKYPDSLIELSCFLTQRNMHIKSEYDFLLMLSDMRVMPDRKKQTRNTTAAGAALAASGTQQPNNVIQLFATV